MYVMMQPEARKWDNVFKVLTGKDAHPHKLIKRMHFTAGNTLEFTIPTINHRTVYSNVFCLRRRYWSNKQS